MGAYRTTGASVLTLGLLVADVEIPITIGGNAI